MLNLHDSRAPELYPQFRNTAYRYSGLVAARHETIRCAEGFEPLWIALPEEQNATLAINAIYEARVSIAPGSYIIGFSGQSAQAAGFEVRILDLRDQALFWSKPANWQNVTGQTPLLGVPNPVFYLPEPRLILEPGTLSVRIRNLDTVNANLVQFVMHVEQPCTP
jgi:hypothetical protein